MTFSTSLDRQLQRMGVDPVEFHIWRWWNGLPRLHDLPLPQQELVMWWLLRRAA